MKGESMKKTIFICLLILFMLLMTPMVNFHCMDCHHYEDTPSTTQNQVLTETQVMPYNVGRTWYFLNR